MSAPIESPCVSVCLLDPDADFCKGCYRSIDEIARWASMTPAERRSIIAELDKRKNELKLETE